MEVESSKQKSLTGMCYSMTFDSRSHLVAPAVSTEYPVIQEDACSSSTQSRRTASLGPGQRGRARNSQNHGVSLARGTWPFMILEESSIFFEENTHIDSSWLRPKSSAAALVKKVRHGRYIRLLLEFFMNWAHCLQVDQFEW